MRRSLLVFALVGFATHVRAQDAEELGASAEVAHEPDGAVEESLGYSSVSRIEMDERQARSSPEALRFEPGVAIQQTAHAQASPYVRGMTGQQVVHLFDGIRMNNGIYRQGPNQYFFTVDQRSVARLDVLRGSSSVRFGSDALGGAIAAVPLRPLIEPGLTGVRARPRVSFRYGSADRELGGRGALELRLGSRTAILIGGGYRDVDLLRSGGAVPHIDGSNPNGGPGMYGPYVPRFAEEADFPNDPSRWRSQLGTGFREATFDARLEHRLPGPYRKLRLVAATYGYRQLDAPRTDKCPPREAPIDECLIIERQWRTLSYVGLRGDAGPMRNFELLLSHQRHLERRVRNLPRSFVRFDWDDVVDTLGITMRAQTPKREMGNAWARIRYGFDIYRDGVQSRGAQSFTDVDIDFELSRGQYLDGASYLNMGMWGEVEIAPRDWITLRSGVRGAVVAAKSPPDPESGTDAVDATFAAVVGRAGVEVRPAEQWSIGFNVDQGFRAPNLDDLTSRQQTGPGFQLENTELDSERTLTTEVGLRFRSDVVRLDVWAFSTLLDDGIQRVVLELRTARPKHRHVVLRANNFS